MSTFKPHEYVARSMDSSRDAMAVVSRCVSKQGWPDYIVHESTLYLFNGIAEHPNLSNYGDSGANYVRATEGHPLYESSTKELRAQYSNLVKSLNFLEANLQQVHDEFVAEFLRHESPEPTIEAVAAFFAKRDLGEDLIGKISSRKTSIAEYLYDKVNRWPRYVTNWDTVHTLSRGDSCPEEFRAELRDMIESIKDGDHQYRFDADNYDGDMYVQRSTTIARTPPKVDYVFETVLENVANEVNNMRIMWATLSSSRMIDKFLGSFE